MRWRNFLNKLEQYEEGDSGGVKKSVEWPEKILVCNDFSNRFLFRNVKGNELKKYIEEAKDQIKIVFVRCSKEIRRIRMITRGDDLESIKKRLLNDDNVFSDEIKKLADFVIDSSISNTEKDAKIVYDFYKKYI